MAAEYAAFADLSGSAAAASGEESTGRYVTLSVEPGRRKEQQATFQVDVRRLLGRQQSAAYGSYVRRPEQPAAYGSYVRRGDGGGGGGGGDNDNDGGGGYVSICSKDCAPGCGGGTSPGPFVELDADMIRSAVLEAAADGDAGAGSSGLPGATARDWNREYAQLFELPCHTPYDLEQRSQQMAELQREFVEYVTAVVRVLVAERGAPSDAHRLVPPLEGRGILGGRKFCVGSVFFKFAEDHRSLLGGDVFAQKVALNEVRTLNHLVDRAADLHIHLPLTAVVRSRGHCVVCAALAPVGPDTLVFGSDDGGAHVRDSNPRARDALVELVRDHNLALHEFRAQSSDDVGPRSIKTPVGADVELHVGADGRMYAIDLGRVFPPAFASLRFRLRPFLHVQLRPEFLRIYCRGAPLSSDALSGFGRVDGEALDGHLQSAVREHLLGAAVPSAALELEPPKVQSAEWPATELHERGVNVWLIGVVREMVPDVHPRKAELQRALLEAMCLRACKERLMRHARKVAGPWAAADHLASQFLSSLVVLDADPSPSPDGSSGASRPVPNWLRREIELKFDLLPSHPLHFSDPELADAWSGVTAGLLVAACRLRWLHSPGLSDTSEPAGRARVGFVESVSVVRVPNFDGIAVAEGRLLRELAIREVNLGRSDPRLLSTLTGLVRLYTFCSADEAGAGVTERAEPVVRRTAEILTADSAGVPSLERARHLVPVAYFWEMRGDVHESERLYRLAIAAAESGGDAADREVRTAVAWALVGLAGLFRVNRRFDEAKPLQYRALDLLRGLGDLAGEAEVCNQIAALLRASGDLLASEKMYERSLSLREELFGRQHPIFASTLNSYALLLKKLGQLSRAEELYREVLALRRQRLGEGHFETARVMCNLGDCLVARADQALWAEAEDLYRRALQISSDAMGPSSHDAATSAKCLADFLRTCGRREEARHVYEMATAAFTALVGADHPHTAYCQRGLDLCK